MTEETDNAVTLACQAGDILADVDDMAEEYTTKAAALLGKDDATAAAALGVAKSLMAYRQVVKGKLDAAGVKPVKMNGRYLSATARHDLMQQFGISEKSLIAGGRMTFLLGERKSVALIMSLLIERGIIEE